MGLAISWFRSWFEPALSFEELEQRKRERYIDEFRTRVERLDSAIKTNQTRIRNQERVKGNREHQLVELLQRTKGMPQTKSDKQQALRLLEQINQKDSRIAQGYSTAHKLEQVKETWDQRVFVLTMNSAVADTSAMVSSVDMGKIQEKWESVFEEINEMERDHRDHEAIDIDSSKHQDEDELEQQLERYCMIQGLKTALKSQPETLFQNVLEGTETSEGAVQHQTQRVNTVRQLVLS